ncbi:MAG: hypothetical protein M3T96_09405 [Acidobacteriota bacterium]|nr:hypothetical protein [Acidobacteriota bacterium]
MAACGDQTVADTDDIAEANQMYDILYSNNLHVEKVPKTGEKIGWNIIINEGWFGQDEAAVATQVLNDHGLPRPKAVLPTMTNAYGMESSEDTKKRQNREKEIQIENLLYGLSGVIRVSVIVSQPDNDILSIQKTLPTATVLIVQTESEPKFSIETVQNMVSGTTTELKPENVKVGISQQILREIPLDNLRAKQHSNAIFALGGGLIVLLIAALAAIWWTVKRRQRQATDISQMPDGGGEIKELDADEQYALNAAEEEEY